MPYRRFDWHEHITEVWGEFRSARAAIDHLRIAVSATPDLLKNERVARDYLSRADQNLDGTYIIRLFAAFEAALRSFDRVKHKDLSGDTNFDPLEPVLNPTASMPGCYRFLSPFAVGFSVRTSGSRWVGSGSAVANLDRIKPLLRFSLNR